MNLPLSADQAGSRAFFLSSPSPSSMLCLIRKGRLASMKMIASGMERKIFELAQTCSEKLRQMI